MGDFNGDNYNDRFLGELVNFVASDSFQTMFESFFITHAVRFSDDEEHRLDYYEMYQNFHDLFDKQLEDFCAQQDISHTEYVTDSSHFQPMHHHSTKHPFLSGL